MNDNGPQHEPKLNDFEIIAGTIVLGIFDVADFFQFGVPGSDLIAFPLLQFWMYKKNIKGTTVLIGNGLELLPFVDYLPVRTAAFLITAWMDHHPSEFSQKIEQLGEMEQALEGKGGGAGAKGALQAEGKAASEAAALAEGEAAQGTAGAAARGGAGGAQGAARAGEAGQESTFARHRKRFQGGGGGQGSVDEFGDEEGPEEGTEEMSLEERRRENAIRGRDIEDLKEDLFGADTVFENIDTPTLGAKVLEFDPDRAMMPKPTRRPQNRKNNSIIESEQVDLTNNEQKRTAA